MLAEAIVAVAGDHGERCDLDNPGTPASTVCLLRLVGRRIDYLVLADSPLVLDRGDAPQVMTDDRFAAVAARLPRVTVSDDAPVGSPAYLARVRAAMAEKYTYLNREHGYWIASTDPAAAYRAVTGTASLDGADGVRRAALLTDGASAAVELFGLFGWGELLDVLTDHGPGELIRRVRAAERDGAAGMRYKRHDDATAALCLFGDR